MLQKKKYTTPTTRFASITQIKDFSKPKFINFYKLKKNILKTRKRFYKKSGITLITNFLLNCGAVTKYFFYNKKPYQSFLGCTTYSNQKLVIPAVEFLMPGKKVFDLTKEIIFRRINYLGSKIKLVDLPYYTFISAIYNNKNTKSSYARASGSFGIKLKGKKTIKLILIKLPSEKIYFFFKETAAFIGKNTNFFNNKFIEGKWGFGIHNTKVLTVRGVAKNPVDHPNGGRTKAKQPEKSPWG